MRKMLGLGRKRGAPEEGEEDEGHHPPSPPQRASLSAFYSGVAHRGPDTGKAHRYAAEGEVGRLLQQVRRKGPNPLDQHGRTPLHFACATGRVNVVGFLMRNKCQLDICDNDGISPLMKAIQCQQEPCALYLLDHGADAKLSDLHGNTALHLAAAKGSTTLVQRLLDHHTDLEAQNQDGSTPLMIAVSENGREMTEFLLKKGASVHVTDKAGRTPLLIAACHRNWDLASLLLSYGSDISHKDDSGWSVEDYATVCDAAA